MKSAALMALRFFVAFEIASVVADLVWHEIDFTVGDIVSTLAFTVFFAAPAALIAAALWWRVTADKQVSSGTSSESRAPRRKASDPPTAD